ncbi:hypothetical protein T492DRAFT_1061346 [Pavlovales sp. CCMP2436]|nr:hypothetical protein T492DRAFT_1061346 [Pavlovales sp. CCMP2436]
MKARIIVSTGARIELDFLEAELTVLELKQQVAGAVAGLDASQQRAIYRGKVLVDARTLGEISFQDGDSIHIVRGVRPVMINASSVVPTGNAPPSPFGGMPGMDSESMKSAMDSPMMQAIMSNPETLKALIFSNPEMRALVEANPEIGHLLTDPNVLRQTVETARNPALMREMTRTSDRAMSNIEAHPEGFNALRRMYNTIGPLSQIGSGAEEEFESSEPSRATESETPNTEALPNPWASPQQPPPRAQPRPILPVGIGGGVGGLGAFGGPPRRTLAPLPRQSSMPQPPGAAAGVRGASGQGGLGADSGNGFMGAMAANPAMLQSMTEMMQSPAFAGLMGGRAAGGLGEGGAQPQAGAGGHTGAQGGTDMAGLAALLAQQRGQARNGQQQQQQMAAMLMQMQQAQQQPGAAAHPFAALVGLAQHGAPLQPAATSPSAAGGMSEAARGVARTRYANEVRAILDMGFDGDEKILDALIATGGNVNAAIGWMLG